ncbi:MAG: hypothetical protein L0Y71_01890 [Gemmataceae bacterium]|nr:hypothetical protein [Gemmataceae bacterium]
MPHFQRRIEPRCLYCHSQEAHPVEHTVNRYEQPVFGQLAIGCERCHGPGELHVAARRKGLPADEVDYSIVNPRHLAPALREAVCEQCHLQGEAIVPRRGRKQTDYRPGLALHEIVSILVRPPEAGDDKLIVGHVEQMHQSVCFTRSAGRFGCTSCHDPHRAPAPAEKIAFYRDRCRRCHLDTPKLPADHEGIRAPDCSMPRAERTARATDDNCLTCHMPRHTSSVGSHLAVTDHRVLRRPDRPPKRRSELGPEDIPLLAFHRQRLDPNDQDLARDLAVGVIPLAALAHDDGARHVSAVLGRRAVPLLEKATARAPDDVPALEALGYALFARGDETPKGLRVFDAALALAPDREQTLEWAAHVAQAGERMALAEKYARRLTEQYPHYAGHHERLASICADREDWPQTVQAAQAALRLDPFRTSVRELLIAAHLANGHRAKAQAEFDLIGVIDPELQQRLRPWLMKRIR